MTELLNGSTTILTRVPAHSDSAGPGMADPVAGIAGSAAKSVRPFRSSEAYVLREETWVKACLPWGLGLTPNTRGCKHFSSHIQSWNWKG